VKLDTNRVPGSRNRIAVDCAKCSGDVQGRSKKWARLEFLSEQGYKAVIYVYRPSAMHGAVYSPDVTVGGNAPVALGNGGYFTTFVLPGDVVVSISNVGKRSLTISAVANESYYVKGGTIFMAGGYPALSLVPQETALPEIKECKLIDSGQP
jgi:hypothetical protein